MKVKNALANFPTPDELLEWHQKLNENPVPEINGHIHTPHSFSAFANIEQPFLMAQKESIKVLGINDFYTTDGYSEFANLAETHKIFPLFNIEFMALQNDLQEAGVRVNDPNNPGRTYFSGKGLQFPVQMNEESQKKIQELQTESNHQTFQMVEKLNAFFAANNIEIHFSVAELQQQLAKNLFRERHIAQAVRLAVFDKESTEGARKTLFQKIFSGKELISPLDNLATIENEIRGNLLKAGGAAFVPEDPKAFLSLKEVIEIIIDAGGIPCYPVLLDDSKGNFTDYEANKEKLLQELVKNDVYSVELIPGRNDFKILKDFVTYFNEHGFVVTFGTEHNTPELSPLKVSCRGGVPLDAELMNINYDGAAVIAAHQYLKAQGKEGYLNGRKAKIDQKNYFIKLGKAVIKKYTNN
ncbi:hypothetical protein SAMN05444274_103377 [Mariniphaga anaerophila]|uniref:PHP domain-containing protein n=1 Tax=Mariniphaga anaerophila TaxID=1484053 RepID=A0A1M4YJW3_9BACT|nr:hypothetical protein [Mariniphaga anaerophila]SHF05953.1 hypothetical protein SAMN05444274_103377 [Mariniphaga anaerophila]